MDFSIIVAWICQSCYMYLLNLLHGFVKNSLYFSPSVKQNHLKFDQDFKAWWSFCFELKVLIVKVLNVLGPLCLWYYQCCAYALVLRSWPPYDRSCSDGSAKSDGLFCTSLISLPLKWTYKQLSKRKMLMYLLHCFKIKTYKKLFWLLMAVATFCLLFTKKANETNHRSKFSFFSTKYMQ